MAVIELSVVGESSATKRYKIKNGKNIIGRAVDCDIVLNDIMVSRHHAEISNDNGHVVIIKSLNPTNHLYVNDSIIENSVLNNGDKIKIGQTEMSLLRKEDENQEDLNFNSSIIYDSNINKIILEADGVTEDSSIKRSLETIFRVSQTINSTLDLDELLVKMSRTIFKEMKITDYCSIHFYDDKTDSLTFMYGMDRHCKERKKIKDLFSTTLIRYVIKNKKAVLSNDALEDSRFEGSVSIVQKCIHSAICVPIQTQKQIIGAIQIVTTSPIKKYSEEDLKFIAIIGAQAGIAVENARLYESLEKAKILQKEKMRFMQVMVHELKSPLSAVTLMFETVAAGLIPKDKQKEFEEKILTRTTALQGLIVDILKYSRMTDEDTQGKIQLIDLPDYISEFSNGFKKEAEMKDLEFKQNITDEKLEIRIDVQALQLILSNLLSNAIKYTLQGFVEISLKRSGDFVIIAVSDSGIGIPKKDLPNLFKEFFRASNARKSNIDGTGIGLAGINCIIERLGGQLDVQTEENVGSTFTVKLNAKHKHETQH